MKHRQANKAKAAGRRQGVALMLVLITLSVVFVMGLAMVNELPGSARASSNLFDHAQAVYLAESGLTEGIYRLKHPAGGADWTGVSGRALDNSGDTYDVTVTDLGNNQFRITSTSHVIGRRGQTVSHTLQMVVTVETTGSGFAMTRSMYCGSSGVVPARAHITGDAHMNGVAMVLGKVTGEMSATRWVRTLGRGSVGSAAPNADAVDLPDIDFDAYTNYTYNGSAGSAQVVTSRSLARLKGDLKPVTSSNPLGVVIVDGDLILTKDLKVHQGILVVRGNVYLNNRKLEVDGPRGQFSLLTEKSIIFSGASRLTMKSGTAYVGRFLLNGFRSFQSRGEFNDGLVMKYNLPLIFLGELRIDNRAYRDKGVGTAQYFGSGGGGTGLRVVTPVSYSVVHD